uniref:putative Ig domain-containing protein n=1 Tax=uncultured Muriicola sp. TaxID=1583102 RepID=UPI002608D00A
NVFTVQVDATGGSDTATLNITVDALNLPPAFITDPINEINATVGSAYSSTLADDASDPESDPMTFAKVSGPTWLNVAANGTLSGTPGAGDVGANVFTVQVDAIGGSDTATLNITVDALNLPPAFITDPVFESNAMEDVAYSSTLADDASDPESDPMTFSKVSGPAWLNVAANGALSGTPGAGDVGLNSFTVQVDATGGSDTAVLQITIDAAGGPVADFAQSEFTALGSVTGGSIADTVSNDDVYEVLTEAQSGGKPSKRRSHLEHTWTFNVTGGEVVTFYIEAHHDANSEGDDFTFSYSTDNVNFTDMVTVTKTADENTAQFYSLPGSLSGTVYVKVVDTDRTQGNSATDSLYVDAIFITSETSSTPPGAASNPAPANGATGVSTAPTLTWTAGMLASSHDVYFGINPTPGAGEFQGNQSGTSFSPGTLAISTTYYWAVDEVNGAGRTLGPVWSFTTGSGTPEMHVSSIVLGTRRAGKNYRGVATVTIVNSGTGQPVSGATVQGDFTGVFSESNSGVTDGIGESVLTTSGKQRLPFSFTFTVTDVTASGYTYNPANNVETSDSGSF